MVQEDFDKSAGLACVDGDESLYEAVLAVFHEQLTGEFAALGNALRQGADEQTTRQVHTLKGSAGSVGAKRLEAAAAAIDRQLKSGAPTPDESLVAELEAAMRSAAASLRAMG